MTCLSRVSFIRRNSIRRRVHVLVVALGFALFCPLGFGAGLEAESGAPFEKQGEKTSAELFELIAEPARACRRFVETPSGAHSNGTAAPSAISNNHGRVAPACNLADQLKLNGFGGPLRL